MLSARRKKPPDIVKSCRSPYPGYVYCASHGFFYDQGKSDIRHMLKYAGDELTHVLFAGTYNQTRDCRYNGGIHGAVANVMKCMPEKHVKFAEELVLSILNCNINCFVPLLIVRSLHQYRFLFSNERYTVYRFYPKRI